MALYVARRAAKELKRPRALRCYWSHHQRSGRASCHERPGLQHAGLNSSRMRAVRNEMSLDDLKAFFLVLALLRIKVAVVEIAVPLFDLLIATIADIYASQHVGELVQFKWPFRRF
jgi:hypothetical protein